MAQRLGRIFVVSAPSGAGKNTVLREALRRDAELALSITATTRAPRPGEADGVDYVFLSAEEFDRRIAEGAFVEWADVHGHRYGTLREPLDRLLASGRDAVLQIDVQGMRSLRASGLPVVTIFLAPPSLDELERRLRDRGTERENTIRLRLENARRELAARDEYDYVVVNDVVDHAVDRLLAIVAAERAAGVAPDSNADAN